MRGHYYETTVRIAPAETAELKRWALSKGENLHTLIARVCVEAVNAEVERAREATRRTS